METPRDRKATFDPKIVAKGQTRWTGRMYDSGEELLHPEEIQQRFKKIFGRDMDRTEREVFFLPVEPSPEQEDND